MRLDRMPAHERAAHKARLLSELPLPDPYTVEGVRIEIRALRFAGGNLVVYLEATRGGRVVILSTEDHVIVNPPLKAPDPAGMTFSTYHQRLGSFDMQLHVEDFERALKDVVAQVVLTTLEHREA